MTTSAQLARIHFDTAVALVGRAQISAWLSAAPAAPTPTPTPAPATTTGRGRKAGAVAADEERCTWTLGDGTRCKNRHQPTAAYCKIHLKNIHLVDDATATAGAGAFASDDE